MLRGAASQNQRPYTHLEHELGKKTVLNGRLGAPEHTGGKTCLQCLGPTLLRHHLFAALCLFGALLQHIRHGGYLR